MLPWLSIALVPAHKVGVLGGDGHEPPQPECLARQPWEGPHACHRAKSCCSPRRDSVPWWWQGYRHASSTAWQGPQPCCPPHSGGHAGTWRAQSCTARGWSLLVGSVVSTHAAWSTSNPAGARGASCFLCPNWADTPRPNAVSCSQAIWEW